MKKIISFESFKSFAFLSPFACFLAGVTGGLFQAVKGLGILLPLSLILFFMGIIKADRLRTYLLCIISFIVPYYFAQFSFLFTLTDYVPFSPLLSFGIATFVVILVTVVESVIFLLPMLFGFNFKGTLIRCVAVSLLFVLGEHFLELLPIFPFPWSRVENAFAYKPAVIETASLFGGSFAAFIILFSSSLIAAGIINRKTPSKCCFCLLFGLALFLSNAATGQILLLKNHQEGKPIYVMVVQTSIEGREKDNVSPREMAEGCARLIRDNFTSGTELIILPETAVCTRPTNTTAFLPLINAAKETGAVIITGCFTDKDDKSYNSLIAIEPDDSISESFDKGLLVPFGEYAPILDEYFAMNDLSPGEKIKSLETSVGKIAAAICIESVLPFSISEQCRDGCGLLIVPTNDSWFGQSGGRELHFRHCVLRAIESGRYLLRSGNCGISAIISPKGEILNAEYSKNEAVLSQTVYYTTQNTLYTRLGDVIILPSLIILAAGIAKFIKYAVLKIRLKLL